MSTMTGSPQPHSTSKGHPRRWLGLGVLCASLLIVVMDLTVLNVALPSISADLHPSSVQLLWMVDVYALAVAGLLVPASGLADRFGRRRMLMVGYVMFGAVPLLVLIADSPAWVIALRALLGVGGAFIMPPTMSLIRNLFLDSRERAVAIGAWGAMAAVGSGLGPIVGGALLEHFSWRAAFLFNTPVMIAAIVAAMLVLPEGYGAKVRWDAVGVLTSIVGMTALIYAVKAFGKDGLSEPKAWIAAATATFALLWFARRSLTRSEPLLDLRLLRRPALSAGLVCALASSVTISALMLLVTQWMQLVEGFSPLKTGVYLLPFAIVAGVLSPLAPRFAERIGPRIVMAGGLAVGGIGLLALYPGSAISYWAVVATLILTGAGMASLAIGSAVIIASAPAERSGNAAVLEESAFEFGNAFGVATLGSLAAVVYAGVLTPSALADLGVSGESATAAGESLGGATSVADGLDAGGAELAAQAQSAFTDGLSMVGLVGGVVMLAVAVTVWLMTPRDLSFDDAGH